eukprot:TRINITY_DN210_c0_g1_i2.p1 TRINITY_DN210_c0_g1~~TRINITY_DN210_c0_g1_i2.p1  ORF type:complete len:152 (+),score=31.39 TRINITY_DN210_c0_g1_i2:215-670(+)
MMMTSSSNASGAEEGIEMQYLLSSDQETSTDSATDSNSNREGDEESDEPPSVEAPSASSIIISSGVLEEMELERKPSNPRLSALRKGGLRDKTRRVSWSDINGKNLTEVYEVEKYDRSPVRDNGKKWRVDEREHDERVLCSCRYCCCCRSN